MHELLIGVNKKGKPAQGLMWEIAKKYDVHWKTVSRIWAKVKTQKKEGATLDASSKKFGRNNRTIIPFDESKFQALEKAKKTSQQAVAIAMGVSQSTVWRWKKKKHIRKHTNAIKPLLTDTNKNDRLFFCISSCSYDEQINAFKFSDMSNIVHIDEKLFYLTRTQQTYYLTPREPEPHRELQSKRFVPKITFMCVVAKPMYSSEGQLIFDGKIGIFPFTAQVLALRSSKTGREGK
ncbi:uncharacterized protein LOC130817809 [Amaranthus tricolor]|uniref:uncharacterized protein LOC130817809 n=1 Tax=Amaranthus tricolor TaxID=29722 RepID=UPI00258A1C31|nr:uncharacterized protein LOC130817809 [Amaranthus tricolor]